MFDRWRTWLRVWVPVVAALCLAGCKGQPVSTDPIDKLGGSVKAHEGGVRITLTGWKGTVDDYELLKKYPNARVLHMANPDVTDQTLEHVRTLSELEDLDLNDTQVTDDGLKALTGLSKLKVLWLENTKVTDKGLEILGPLDSLMRLELTGSAATKEGADAWKAARPGRKYNR
jgi:hypothetical protein